MTSYKKPESREKAPLSQASSELDLHLRVITPKPPAAQHPTFPIFDMGDFGPVGIRNLMLPSD